MTKQLDGFSKQGCSDYFVTRRQFVLGAASSAGMAFLPKSANASGTGTADPRLLVVILRGALDGLAIVPPLGDPHYEPLRESFMLSGNNVLNLDGFFGLNANMPNLANLYRGGDATVFHATATSYRSRSLFDGQDILETGGTSAGRYAGDRRKTAAGEGRLSHAGAGGGRHRGVGGDAGRLATGIGGAAGAAVAGGRVRRRRGGRATAGEPIGGAAYD